MKQKFIQVSGDVDALLFGGVFQNTYTGDYIKVIGPDMSADHKEDRDKCEVYYLSPVYDDPLNASWVDWDKVLDFTGDKVAEQTGKERAATLTVLERIEAVADYYGWSNHGEPAMVTAGFIRRHILRGAANLNGSKI